ncbi:MAG: guanylate kinase [Bacteroidales bacterium]|nr:guanylate kinase [Bacteroidales bacterium]
MKDNEIESLKLSRAGVLIFSAPSGAGKSTVVQHLMNKYPFLGFSVSATSRKPRGEEVNGKEYHFLTVKEFKEKIKNNEFVEYEEVYDGLYYGTLKSEVERLGSQGKVLVFDIDVKGGITLKRIYGPDALSVFIMPPSTKALRDRLTTRGTETPEAIEKRVAKANEEIGFSGQFDQIIINDVLDECLTEAENIVEKFYLGLK